MDWPVIFFAVTVIVCALAVIGGIAASRYDDETEEIADALERTRVAARRYQSGELNTVEIAEGFVRLEASGNVFTNCRVEEPVPTPVENKPKRRRWG